MVVVDNLSKETHFSQIKSTYKATYVVDVFVKESFRLHDMPKTIMSYRDAKFTSNLWKSLFAGFGTQVAFNKTYHPQTNGKIERVNIVLEYMLRIHVMHQPMKWEDYLPLVEFSYNNSYPESSIMIPFEGSFLMTHG
jgi:transposase InsO family protein